MTIAAAVGAVLLDKGRDPEAGSVGLAVGLALLAWLCGRSPQSEEPQADFHQPGFFGKYRF